MRRRASAITLFCAIAMALASCGAGQDPGVDPNGGQSVPKTTSNTLPPCPSSGATVGPAGCLDGNGNVVHP
jgi:predicted small secreted protein